jgi:hypothetical protein
MAFCAPFTGSSRAVESPQMARSCTLQVVVTSQKKTACLPRMRVYHIPAPAISEPKLSSAALFAYCTYLRMM